MDEIDSQFNDAKRKRKGKDIDEKVVSIEEKPSKEFIQETSEDSKEMKTDDFWNKLKELYELNPILFGFLLFLDLLIILMIIKFIF